MPSSTRSGTGISQISISALAVAALAAVHVAGALADEVTSKDTVLRGKITGVTGTGITFEPEYGKGAITIKWENIQDLKSDVPFQILHGDNEEADQPLLGLASDGKLLVGATAATATAIDVTTIFVGIPIGPEGPSFEDRMRSAWRYWDGNFDLGFNLQRATTNTSGFTLGFKTSRTKAPTHFSIGADYRYSTEEKRGEPKTTIQDQFFGFVREQYDFYSPFYAFASGDATYDAIQRLSIRGVPKLGVGCIFWEEQLDETTRNFFQGEVGGGWVYEKYFSVPAFPPAPHPTRTPTNDYFAIAFGLLAGYYLPYGAHWDFKLDYLPAVDDFTGDYLLRGETSLTVPVISVVAAKFSLIDVYDSTPATDTAPNSLYLTVGFSLLW